MSKYEEFKQELASIQSRGKEAEKELQNQSDIIAGLQQDFDQAILENNSERVDELVVELEKAINKEELLKRKSKSLSEADQSEMMKKSRTLKTLAVQAIEENTPLLKEKQEQFDKELSELEEIKKQFFDKVKQLGEIYREGGKVGAQLSELKEHTTGKITSHSIQFKWSDIQKTGAIYIDVADCERIFKNVGDHHKIYPSPQAITQARNQITKSSV